MTGPAMKGIRPLRKIASLVALAAIAAGLHLFYHGAAAASFVAVKEQMAAEAEQTRQDKVHVVQMQENRLALKSVQSRCDRIRQRLVSTPDVLEVWSRMELDLKARGYDAPAFMPEDEQASMELGGYGSIREQVFRFSFRSRFHDTVELLDRWENLEYGIRMTDVVITPHSLDDLISVQLTFRLRKLVPGESP